MRLPTRQHGVENRDKVHFFLLTVKVGSIQLKAHASLDDRPEYRMSALCISKL